MCGLAGMVLTPHARSAAHWQQIRDSFTANFLANEVRGRDASGIALITTEGTYLLHKEQMPASALVKTDRYRFILDQLDENSVCLLGHTRLPTKGTTANGMNNHPIVANHLIGIHNGRINNDDEVFEHFHFLRRGQVDSEVIFTLLGYLSPGLLAHNYLQHAANMMAVLQGPMAVLAVDLRQPTRLLVVKSGSPLGYHYEPAWGAVVFSSRYLFLRKTFGRGVLREKIDDGTVIALDAYRLPEMQMRTVERVPPPPALSYLRERRW